VQQAIVISGFGGQGTLFAGMVLAYAGMDHGKHVTWIPSYGPEMRGGTANATVIVSDEEIGSPVVRYPDTAVVLNNPSMEKYEPLIKAGGVLVANISLVSAPSHRPDITYVPVPASDVATQLGDVRMANMVALGALAKATKILPVEAIVQALQDHLPERKRYLLEPNQRAVQEGAQIAERGEWASQRISESANGPVGESASGPGAER